MGATLGPTSEAPRSGSPRRSSRRAWLRGPDIVLLSLADRKSERVHGRARPQSELTWVVEAFGGQGPRGRAHVANLALSDNGLGFQSSLSVPLTVVRLLQCRLGRNVRLGPQIVLARLAAENICAHVATTIARPKSPGDSRAAKRSSDEQSRRTESLPGVVPRPEVFDGTESRAMYVDMHVSFA